MKQVKQENNIYTKHFDDVRHRKTAGCQFENSTMIWQGQL